MTPNNESSPDGRVAELLAEASRLSARLAAVTSELESLIGDPQAERFARFRTAEFTRQLTEHLHAAKKAALEEAGASHAGP